MIKRINPEWIAPAQISAVCSTRLGGVSAPPYDSLNLGAHVGDSIAHVTKNRDLLKQALQLPQEPCWINQTHGTDVVTLEVDVSRDADAAITRKPGFVAAIMTADCLPILVCNRQGTEVAAIHAGWRGLEAGVIQSTLASMTSQNDDLIGWIGPGISQACFEVGEEVREAFMKSSEVGDIAGCFVPHGEGHWLCDLAGLAELVLTRQGLNSVYRDRHCTYRDDELLFSYRRNAITGRMVSLIWINH
jgi:YfiH family protein